MQTPLLLPLPARANTASPFAAGTRPAGRKIRVLVVDDSMVIRRFITRVLSEDSAFEVVGFAANGALALVQEGQLHPDVITMDIEMPQMDGLATVTALRGRGSKAIIIMCSTLTTTGGSATIEALIRGANDYVTKPAGDGSMDRALEALRGELIPKIKQFFIRNPAASAPAPAAAWRPGVTRILPDPMIAKCVPTAAAARTAAEPCEIVAIGVSTGGPTALLDLLPRFPATFPLPIVIVQHMPPIFTKQLANRLNAESAIEVLEAEEGATLAPGRALLAPGDYHLRLKRTLHEVRATLDQGERENSCRPAIDVLFRSVRAIYGGRTLAVILTGMGQDGLRGAEELKRDGAYVIAQDRASSVVWGMPGAVVGAGLADAVVSLGEIASAILKRASK